MTVYEMGGQAIASGGEGHRATWDPARVATTVALPAYTFAGNILTANANGVFPVTDGETLALGDILLVKDEAGANEKYNGRYVLTQSSVGTPWKLQRTADADTSAEFVPGRLIAVAEGTVNADTVWEFSADLPFTLNTDPVTFKKVDSSGFVPTSRTVQATTPLLIDGSNAPQDLSANRVWSIPAATGANAGHMTAAQAAKLSVLPAVESFMAAAAMSTTVVTPEMAGQFQWKPAEHGGTVRKLRVILSVSGGATATLTLRNLTDGSDVEIGGVGDPDLTTTSATPTVLESVDLVGASGWNNAADKVYEVRLKSSDVLQTAVLGSAYLVVS